MYIGNHLSASKGYAAMGRMAVKLGANTFAFFTRNPRGGAAKAIDPADVEKLLELMRERAKGLSEAVVVNKHAFKNELIPIITVLSMQIPTIFSGAVLTETIFVWPGIGRLSYTAILDRDYPLIMALLLMTTVIILLSNLIADLLFAVIDPRIRYE